MDKHLLLSLAIPAIFLGFAGIVRSVIGTWRWQNFYLGVDLALASLANGIINIADLSQVNGAHDLTLSTKMQNNAILLVLAIGVLLGVMAMHKRLENPPPDFDGRHWRRDVLLGLVANVLGAAPLALFIMKRLQGKL